MKLLKLAILFICAGLTLSNAQNRDEQDNQTGLNFLQNSTFESTKSLQKYYQSVFDFNIESSKNSLTPSFDVDKEKLLESLRERLPLEGPVDQNKYIVGPGDVFEISVTGNIPFNVTVPVTPEGSLIIPTFSILEVSGLTLSAVKDTVRNNLRKKFLKGEINATLISPRIFSVTVSGIVNNPGQYYAASVQKVDQVIYLANLQNPALKSNVSEIQNQNEKEVLNKQTSINYFNSENSSKPTELSLRNIKLIRKNNDTLSVDLMRFYASGDSKYNPYLSDGDRIIVPNKIMEGNSISISGAVKLEGTYEYSPNDSLTAVFEIAQGPTGTALMTTVDIFRFDINSRKYNRITVNVEKIINGIEDDMPLYPGDRIVVREKDPNLFHDLVEVKGEVLYPGFYPIVRNETKLTEIIELAGGFTKDALLTNAKIIRSNNPLDAAFLNPDYERLVEMRLSDMNPEDRAYFNYESAIKRNFVSVDFNKLFLKEDSSNNVILENNDIILIPKDDKTIYIFGQVVNPGYIEFTDGRSYEFYISRAGGVTDMADEGDIRIIKAGSQNWLEPCDTEIEAGDAIWIPRERLKEFEYYFYWFSQIVAVVGGVATIILLTQK